ncbi:hypothetical protein BDV96DRAFT_584051, partial [Lophiotrema nucula]
MSPNKPTGGNVHHWALWLEETEYSRLFKVIREPGRYKVSKKANILPKSSVRHKSNVFVAQIDNYNGFITHARSYKALKDSTAWNYLEYVMHVLEAANLDDIINNYKYNTIKTYLKSIFN